MLPLILKELKGQEQFAGDLLDYEIECFQKAIERETAWPTPNNKSPNIIMKITTKAQANRAAIVNLLTYLTKLYERRELIEARGNLDEMIRHEHEIGQTLKFLEVLTAWQLNSWKTYSTRWQKFRANYSSPNYTSAVSL